MNNKNLAARGVDFSYSPPSSSFDLFTAHCVNIFLYLLDNYHYNDTILIYKNIIRGYKISVIELFHETNHIQTISRSWV